ncbi:MAG: NRAMP family divalent metal transporter [Chloroflexota bacterium]
MTSRRNVLVGPPFEENAELVADSNKEKDDLNTGAPAGLSAVLDEAHAGDIRGALGSIRQDDLAPRRSWKARLVTLAAIMGPGLIVMVGDNDAGGVSTYAQAGQNYGTSLLWTLLLLIPVLIVNQEMVVRLGAVTGVGHGRLIFERFGKYWGAFSVGDLFILNFLTIVTEFIGISLAGSFFGVSPYLSVPLAAGLLIGVTVTGSFERWERFMFAFLAANVLVIPIAVLSHPHVGQTLHDAAVPGIKGGFSSAAVLLIIAIVGTTVAPWQLFFQQSNIIDKRITPRWMGYERVDTVIGAFVVIIGAAALMIAPALAFAGGPQAGQFTDAGAVARGLAHHFGQLEGTLFAIVLLDASIIGASAVTLATSYAFGDVFGLHHSLHRPWREAKKFYASFAALVVLAAAIVLIPQAPLGLITTAVQALAGVLLPSATVFLLLLCNDHDVLGPWVNPPWLNVLASIIVAILLMLSGILVVTTVFPAIDVGRLVEFLGAALALALAMMGGVALRGRQAARPLPEVSVNRDTWRMPPLALLGRPPWSRGRMIGMWALRGYLVLAVLLLVVRAVQIATAHP